MADVRPVRLQLSRRKGFDLQKLSRETNGLPAVNVARPSKWGNPFVVGLKRKFGRKAALGYIDVATTGQAVCSFQEMIALKGGLPAIGELHGKNLACWCRLGTPCHADVLLELANAEPAIDAALSEEPAA